MDNRDTIRTFNVGDKFRYRGREYTWYGHISTVATHYDIAKVWNAKGHVTKVQVSDLGKVERL